MEIGPALVLTPGAPEPLSPNDPDLEKLYAIKKAVDFMWDFDAVPFDWDEADTKAAKAIIAELPSWNADQFAFAVLCRFQSFHINSAEAPRHWLKKLQKYGLGPLNEYGHDTLNPQERQNYREKRLAELAGRKPAGEQILLIKDEPQEVFSGKPQNSAWEKLPTWLSQKIQTELRHMAEASVGARVDRADPDTLRRSVLIAAERAGVWPHVAEQLADESYAAAIANKKPVKGTA